MGKAKQEVKPRTCQKCGLTFECNAATVKAHAKGCEGKA